jgi:peptidoglycan hydrolase-like protein with peptidoglycan-binding domain
MLCGRDSAETALLVARQIDQSAVEVGGLMLYSEEYAAAAAGPLAATAAVAGGKLWPLLYVPSSGTLPEDVAEAISGLSPGSVVLVQTSVEIEDGPEVTVLTGADRYELAANVAEFGSGAGLSFSHTAVLCGSNDLAELGLAIGAYLARTKGLAVLTDAEAIPVPAVRVLCAAAGITARVDFCGPLAASQRKARLLLEAESIPEGFAGSTLKQGAEGGDVMWLEQRLTDLSYRPGPVDGVFDKRTRHAVIAFQKWEGLSRDGVAGAQVWWHLLEAVRPTPAYAEEGKNNAPQGRWIEVDRKKQVLLYCVEGVVERTLPVSTGSARVGVATPSGIYFIQRENTYERVRYKPLYLSRTTVLAIHGYTSVPVYPASHGCIRMTWADMDEFHDLIPLGTPVLVY